MSKYSEDSTISYASRSASIQICAPSISALYSSAGGSHPARAQSQARLYAQRKLAARGIEIITHARVTAAVEGAVTLSNGQKMSSNMLIWAAGTAPNSLLNALPLPKRNGRIVVNENLEVEGFPDLWVLGDCAMVPNSRTGGFHSPTAQHAIREARVLAHNVTAEFRSGQKQSFRYTGFGQLAAIGRRTGVANILGLNFSGFIAWWLWRTIYLSKFPRVEKKIRAALDWTLDLCFAKDFASVNPPPMRNLRTVMPGQLLPTSTGLTATASKAQLSNASSARTKTRKSSRHRFYRGCCRPVPGLWMERVARRRRQ